MDMPNSITDGVPDFKEPQKPVLPVKPKIFPGLKKDAKIIAEDGEFTRFEKNASRLGYIKKPKKMTAFEVFALICFMSFMGSVIIMWSAWFVKSVQTGIFLFNWITFAETIQQTGTSFVQVVLGKILNVLHTHFDPEKLADELNQSKDKENLK